ncbi:MAG: hypothetical protein Q8L37_07305 [Candidatus Gottesmanbacteria bacterium]|nr:hypothetical protein [Candidatus Gottesmanbacteria bacterium]
MFIEVDKKSIKKIALDCQSRGATWHYHLFSPTCRFNTKSQFGFVVEDRTNNTMYISYSSKPMMELGKELLALLHNVDVKKSNTMESNLSPSSMLIAKRAQELISKGALWHHHMFPPSCAYNDTGKWKIALEDPETHTILESLSADVPTSDLQVIESLYYSQTSIG